MLQWAMNFNEMGIRNLDIGETGAAAPEWVRFAFGPHYFIEVINKDGEVKLLIGSTHHGVTLDASKVGGELEDIINEIRRTRPETAFD